MKRSRAVAFAVIASLVPAAAASASTPGTDVRVTKDCLNLAGDPMSDPTAPLAACAGGGYVSAWTLTHPASPYTDEVIDECAIARGRQNEPAVEVDPRDTRVLIGSSNDYCGVFAHGLDASGPVWLGYYRSETSGSSWVDSLVPGYPEDSSPYASLADVRTAGAGDPVIAWDRHGRVFMGAESSGDPAGTAKSFGDVWVARYVNPDGPDGGTLEDGKEYAGTETVGQGSSAPGLLGKFNDKTAIEVDRTGGPCDGSVYFAWSRFTGGGSNGFNSSVNFVRSTDHWRTWTHPDILSNTVHDIQSPDIAVTKTGDIYIAFRQFASVRGHATTDAVVYVRSTDCGRSFSRPRVAARFIPYDATDVGDPEAPAQASAPADEEDFEDESAAGGQPAPAGDCGDFDAHCESGYTFFRHTTQVRATADQTAAGRNEVYVVFDPTKPGTEVASGSTYGSVTSGDRPLKYHLEVGSQEAVYVMTIDGSSGSPGTPELLDPQPIGHQLFPDISAHGGELHAIWYDTRNDVCYDPRRPIGNCADRSTVPALDVYGSTRSVDGDWSPAARITDVTTNPNYEQFAGRTVPFAGDYLWVTSVGGYAFTTWTDYRDVVPGSDPRESGGDEDDSSADVKQCRVIEDGAFGADQCPHAGGLDQNIYGDLAP